MLSAKIPILLDRHTQIWNILVRSLTAEAGGLWRGLPSGYKEDINPWVKAKAVASARVRDSVLL